MRKAPPRARCAEPTIKPRARRVFKSTSEIITLYGTKVREKLKPLFSAQDIDYPPTAITSTQQFVWAGPRRGEERDGTSVVTKKFFIRGFKNGATTYVYTRDLLGSLAEVCDNSGAAQAAYSFDPFGRQQLMIGSAGADFTYAGNYFHSRSSLQLTNFRAYNAALGRFINRDPIQEQGGINLYSYVRNNPATNIDPNGLAPQSKPTRYWIDDAFARETGVPSNVIKQGGCIAVVRFRLNQGQAGLPENNPPPGTDCYWGDGTDTEPAVKKCLKKNCDPGSHLVIWCKQGHLGSGQAPGDPGSPVPNPGGIWDGGADKSGYFNYAVYNQDSGMYYGANTDGGCGYTSGSMQGASDSMNGSMCCASCVKN
ncbi:MAG TPA: RHS repeat-associated core domain-containing protein [Candidatus Melainabacteria bacterium]|nr:RHS repeat-associated core domain-containing protein [Candidatus Melainabacteria bacterium]HIN63792.1 RHS repeat-associated core domain-containing protein [Candidatus Obscuribacterales bacterium]